MTKQKQKIISLLLLLLMAVVAVCGCGGTEADTEAVLPQENAEPAEATVADATEQPAREATAEQQDNAKDSKTAEPQQSAQVAAAKQGTAPAKQEPAAAPAPATKPEPKQEPTCTISISCAAALAHLDQCDGAKAELIPQDGWILQPIKVTIQAEETVFDVLLRTCKEQKIPLEFTDTPMYGSSYIEGIYNLYEYDMGDLSGWMYSVNDSFPNYGCSQYTVQNGDVIRWLYTCDMGEDIGGKNVL